MAQWLVYVGPRGRTAGTPVGQESEGAGEIATVRAQAVLHPGWPAGVRPPEQDALALEPPQAVGKNVWCETGKALEQLVEPTRAIEQGLYQEQAPAVADALERGCQR